MNTVKFEETDHFRISDDDIVNVATNLDEDLFTIKNSLKQNHHFSRLRKLSKDEFINLETGEIRKYKQNKYRTKKSIRRSMNKLRELLELNFTDKTNCLFITLTSANLKGFDDFKKAKRQFQKFIRKFKAKYKDIAYVAK